MISVYGIPNCDTVKKARKWLDASSVEYQFHNFKTDGVEREALERWADRVSWEVLLNRRGTTYRKLPEEDRADMTREKAIALMQEHTSLIKRPVVEVQKGQRVLIGFTQSEWENQLA